MAETLGEKLKQAREERGVTISEVAEQTRISPLYLDSIDKDDYRPLPGGIFNKGFIKSYAKYVGVDENEAMQDYAHLMATQEPSEEDEETKTYRPQVLTDNSNSRSMIPTVIGAVIILGLMTWGLLSLVNYMQNRETPVVETNVADNNSNANNNVNANVNVAKTEDETKYPTDKIKVEIKTSGEPVAAEVFTDGKRETTTISGDSSLTVEGQESVRISYYRGLANLVKLNLNGKELETPIPPADYTRNAFVYEINKSNIKEVLQSGKISFDSSADTNANTNTATPN